MLRLVKNIFDNLVRQRYLEDLTDVRHHQSLREEKTAHISIEICHPYFAQKFCMFAKLNYTIENYIRETAYTYDSNTLQSRS